MTVKAALPGASDAPAAEAKVTIAPRASRSWDFGEDIVPILTRMGCNTGSCHGRLEGQNGFHLSLFGYDPAGDYQAVARDAGQRRLSPMSPEESLFLVKASGRTPHVGGPRLAIGSPEYQTMLAWVRDGAPEHRGHDPRRGGERPRRARGRPPARRARHPAAPRRRQVRRRPSPRRHPAGVVQAE